MDNNLISVALKKLLSLVKVPPLQVAAWCDRTTSHPPPPQPRAATGSKLVSSKCVTFYSHFTFTHVTLIMDRPRPIWR